MMKYLTIDNGKFVITDEYVPQDKFAIMFENNGKNDAYIFSKDPVFVDGENILLNGQRVPLKNLTIVPINEHFEELVRTLRSYGTNEFSTKMKLDKIPNPALVPMPMFTGVVCNTILSEGKSIPFMKSQQVRKSSLVRMLKKQIERNKDISIDLAYELLGLYGINPAVMFNQNYIKK